MVFRSFSSICTMVFKSMSSSFLTIISWVFLVTLAISLSTTVSDMEASDDDDDDDTGSDASPVVVATTLHVFL